MARKKVEIPSLSNAEWDVMKVLWEKGELAARDVFAELEEESGWAYTTVKTILSRLVAKGAVDYKQIGNSYLYWPAVGRNEVTHEEIKGFVKRVLDGAATPFLAHFIERTDLSEDEVRELREVLDKKERGE
ncbi:MAG: BlaI/MecI/CopY family transcriptional regulator [Candidatus Omnitrophica bacterium]|nr:BlaI/MecI/CopY family transcriptional regulator [Candidatus Omnitrophota bacterium]